MAENVEACPPLDNRSDRDDRAAANEHADHSLDHLVAANNADEDVDDEDEAQKKGERLQNGRRERSDTSRVCELGCKRHRHEEDDRPLEARTSGRDAPVYQEGQKPTAD